MTTRDCTVIAHRGASAYAPENTFAAFDLAIQMGVSHIELDVHATLDGHIVVIHDDTVDRTTDGAGPVTSHTLAALKALDKGRSAQLSERTADLVRAYGVAEWVTITSFQRARLEETHAYAPELPIGWLVAEVSEAVIAQAGMMGVTQICPRADAVTPELIHRLHAEGFVVRAWGVATEELMRQVVKGGAAYLNSDAREGR